MNNVLNNLNAIDESETCSNYICKIEDLQKFITVKRTDFTLVSQNIRSVYANFDDFLTNISVLDFDTDLFILSECQLDSNKHIPQITGYSSSQTSLHLNKCDGVIAYMKTSLSAYVIEVNLKHASCLQISTPKLTILGIYRSPSNRDADEFIYSLKDHLELIKGTSNVILTGDININLIPRQDEQPFERRNRLNYLEMLESQGFFPGHSLPTRGRNCLDHFILKLDRTHKNVSVAVLDTTITDHKMIFLKMEFPEKTSHNKKTKTITDFEKALDFLKKTNLSYLLEFTDPNIIAEHLITKIQESLTENTTTISIPGKNRILKPWITPGLLRCIRNRNNMQRNLIHDPHNDILRITYRRYRNHCNSILKTLKRNYDRDQLAKARNNPKKLWNTINGITQRKPSKSLNINLLHATTSPQESVNITNAYFASIGKELAEKISYFPNSHTLNYKTKPSQVSSLVLFDTNCSEVCEVIKTMKQNSSSGWDGIPTSFLKFASSVIAPIITHLTNLCFVQGVFPTTLKQAVITPVYKDGNKSDPCNYRPISVLTSLSKLLEKLINVRLTKYLSKFNIIAKNQFGFQSGLSTEDAVQGLTSVITQKVDSGNKCLGVFLDLKKAFDTVSVPILLKRLEEIGVRGTSLRLFEEYLSNRKQRVRLGDHISKDATVTYGVPQGSVLGPTLFLIYINNLCNLDISEGNIFSYADDTAIVFSGKSWSEVKTLTERGLTDVAYWLGASLLTLNTDKTQYICFSKYNTAQPPPNFHIKTHSCRNLPNTNCSCTILNKVKYVKYLGVLVDQRLSWNEHIELTTKRVRKLIWVFKSLRHVARKELITQTYIALAQSMLTYCISVWGSANKTAYLGLERAQRSLLKVMLSKPFRYPTEDLYLEASVLSVRKLYVLNIVLKMHKSLPYDSCLLKRRRKDKVAVVPLIRSEFARRQFCHQSARIYNRINKLLYIYPLNLPECKKLVTQWLYSISYSETELLLLYKK